MIIIIILQSVIVGWLLLNLFDLLAHTYNAYNIACEYMGTRKREKCAIFMAQKKHGIGQCHLFFLHSKIAFHYCTYYFIDDYTRVLECCDWYACCFSCFCMFWNAQSTRCFCWTSRTVEQLWFFRVKNRLMQPFLLAFCFARDVSLDPVLFFSTHPVHFTLFNHLSIKNFSNGILTSFPEDFPGLQMIFHGKSTEKLYEQLFRHREPSRGTREKPNYYHRKVWVANLIKNTQQTNEIKLQENEVKRVINQSWIIHLIHKCWFKCFLKKKVLFVRSCLNKFSIKLFPLHQIKWMKCGMLRCFAISHEMKISLLLVINPFSWFSLSVELPNATCIYH